MNVIRNPLRKGSDPLARYNHWDQRQLQLGRRAEPRVASDHHAVLVDQHRHRPFPSADGGRNFVDGRPRCEAAGCWHSGSAARLASSPTGRPATAGLRPPRRVRRSAVKDGQATPVAQPAKSSPIRVRDTPSLCIKLTAYSYRNWETTVATYRFETRRVRPSWLLRTLKLKPPLSKVPRLSA
jgi:hypothetical protein